MNIKQIRTHRITNSADLTNIIEVELSNMSAAELMRTAAAYDRGDLELGSLEIAALWQALKHRAQTSLSRGSRMRLQTVTLFKDDHGRVGVFMTHKSLEPVEITEHAA